MKISVQGLDELVAATSPAILNRPLAEFLRAIRKSGERAARKYAPRLTSTLARSIESEQDGGTPPLWAEIGTNVTSRGFSYPKHLDESGRTHYRVHSLFPGQQTAGWFSSRTKEDVELESKDALEELGRAIEREWSR